MVQVEKDINSYVSEQEASDYFESRLYVGEWENADLEQKQKALIMATTLLDLNFVWIGDKAEIEQALQFPRKNIPGITEVPKSIKVAQMELALMLLQKNLVALPETAGVKAVQVDAIKLEFDATDRQKIIPDLILALISPYLAQNRPQVAFFDMSR